MAVSKFSQIASASIPAALTDTIIGVQAGTNDVQYKIGDIVPPPASGNLTFYVATVGNGGNDSNPGTFAQPFLTPQHAANIVDKFDYQNAFNATVNVGAGTFSSTSPIQLTGGINQGNRHVLAGAGVANTTIKSSTAFGGTISGGGSWTIQDVTLDGSGSILSAGGGSGITLNNTVNFTDSSASGQSVPFTIGGGGSIAAVFVAMTFAQPFLYFCQGGGSEAQFICTGSNITLPASSFGSAGSNFWLFNQGSGSALYEFFSNTITNSASFHGSQAILIGTGGGIVISSNGVPSDLPGVASGSFYDPSLFWFSFSGNMTGQGVVQTAGELSTSTLAMPFFLVSKDTTNGPRQLALTDNDGVVYTRQIGNFLNTQTGASYTLALFDQEGIVEMTNAGANTVTVPTNASVAFPKGTKVTVVQAGAGATTIAAAGGVTVHNVGALTGPSALLYKRATNEWTQINGAF